jgi:hypothetical protein
MPDDEELPDRRTLDRLRTEAEGRLDTAVRPDGKSHRDFATVERSLVGDFDERFRAAAGFQAEDADEAARVVLAVYIATVNTFADEAPDLALAQNSAQEAEYVDRRLEFVVSVDFPGRMATVAALESHRLWEVVGSRAESVEWPERKELAGALRAHQREGHRYSLDELEPYGLGAIIAMGDLKRAGVLVSERERIRALDRVGAASTGYLRSLTSKLDHLVQEDPVRFSSARDRPALSSTADAYLGAQYVRKLIGNKGLAENPVMQAVQELQVTSAHHSPRALENSGDARLQFVGALERYPERNNDVAWLEIKGGFYLQAMLADDGLGDIIRKNPTSSVHTADEHLSRTIEERQSGPKPTAAAASALRMEMSATSGVHVYGTTDRPAPARPASPRTAGRGR